MTLYWYLSPFNYRHSERWF